MKTWIISRRAERLHVSRKAIQQEALRLCSEIKENMDDKVLQQVAGGFKSFCYVMD